MEFIKRYYKCLYDFKLFKNYIDEPLMKGLLFLLPLFLVFSLQTFFTTMEGPNEVLGASEYYLEHINSLMYSDVNTEDPNNGLDMNQHINVQFFDNKLQLEQDKAYINTFEINGDTYGLVLDTKDTLGVEPSSVSSYNDEEKGLIGLDQADFNIYAGSDFVIISNDDRIETRDLSVLDGELKSSNAIYTFVNDNYISALVYFVLSILVTVVLYLMFFIVLYVVGKTTIRRQGYELSKKRMRVLSIYGMQPGLYVYLILSYVMRTWSVGMTFIVPLVSMIAMTYVVTKTFENVQDFIKKETRQARKKAKKVQLQG